MTIGPPVPRRHLLILAPGVLFASEGPRGLRPILVSINLMFDAGAHSRNGLTAAEISTFERYQENARREFATSGIHFEIRRTEGAYLRQQGYSEIPDKFLAHRTINVFVTETLGYDIDRDRTGGSSVGPRPRSHFAAADPFYKTFLGLREASETTLAHEYAHHFALDTQKSASAAKNFWTDLRNDYWLWRQRHGTPIEGFRGCAGAEWARFEQTR